MAYLFDSNTFLRLFRASDPLRSMVLGALRKLRTQGEVLCYTPQVISEVWNVSTRPEEARGGFGFSVEETERRIHLIERHFRLLPDMIATYEEWRRLVVLHAVRGVKVHDAKLVASMKVYGVTHLMTLNTEDFTRYEDEALRVTHPKDI